MTTLCFSGMSGVFPGAPSIEALWQRVVTAEVAPLTAMPPRWGIDPAAIVAAEPGTANRIYIDRGHCLPVDAGADPVRAAWGRQVAITRSVLSDLLAQAAPAGAAFDGDGVALVLGTSWSDESYFLADTGRHGDRPWFDPGEQVEVLARGFGLRGPALAVDTACSSFAYALDTARAVIESGQARAAIVAGVNAFLPPSIFLGFSQLRALAAVGALRAFGADATGIVPAEAVAAFVVERIDDAARAGRRPLAVLRGLGLSSDGAEGSVFAPGRAGQLASYGRAYRDVDPATIDYVEGHGTGTVLGDATEIESLDRFFRDHVPGGQRLALGSIKALIGHSLAAAGSASLAKLVMMLRHRTLPPHIAVQPNPRIEQSCLVLDRAARVLPPREQPMRVGLSSFGFGGANAHVVLEAPPGAPPSTARAPRSEAATTATELAIVAIDGWFGTAGAASVGSAAAPAAPAAFPVDRFAASGPLPAPDGAFLRGELTIDIAGYRMGPRPLRHVDPFKLLVSHRVSTMLKRLPGAARSADTAIVMCANMGGERFSDAYRKVVGHFADGAGSPDIVVEDVATMLPTMVSGYPASFVDLRGFHETISGGAGAFITALHAAAGWLGSRYRTLIVGAGHYLSSPADVQAVAGAHARHGEGVGLLALKTVEHARADGDRILATLRCIAHGAQVSSLAQARLASGAPGTGDAVEVCELAPASDAALGRSQLATGFLREASGIESVLAAVIGPPRRTAIEVRRDHRAVSWLFIETTEAVALPADPAPKLPLAIAFSKTAAPALPAAPRIEAPAVAEVLPRVAHSISDSYEEIGRTLAHGLTARARALELLMAGRRAAATPAAPASIAERLATLRKDPRNRVISDLQRTDNAARATMIIDEQHPYFFDHPLDHVPGILLIEGALQLVEVASSDPDVFVDGVRVRFKRYAEKAPPIALQAVPDAGEQRWTVTMEQLGQIACECQVSVARLPARDVWDRAVAAGAALPTQSLLHKSREENVLVGALEDHPDGLRARTLPIPAGHCFSDGHPDRLSMLYFLEVGRQCLMLVAHTRLGVPLGLPMSLVSLEFHLDAPIPRHAPLVLVPQAHAEPWNGIIQTSRFEMQLHRARSDGDGVGAPGAALGRVAIVAQVIDKQLYHRQRRSAS
jgi:beta-ketoacyl synthase-like protein/A-factor biosynthesis hotdog protein